MNEENMKHIGFPIEPELYYKIQSISEFYGRSLRKQMRFMVSRYVASFEKKYGNIEIEIDDDY